MIELELASNLVTLFQILGTATIGILFARRFSQKNDFRYIYNAIRRFLEMLMITVGFHLVISLQEDLTGDEIIAVILSGVVLILAFALPWIYFLVNDYYYRLLDEVNN